MKETAQIYHIDERKDWVNVLTDIIDAARKDELIDFVVVARRKFRNEDEELMPDSEDMEAASTIRMAWFGGSSSISILGLLQFMMQHIYDWIAGR